MKQVEPRRLGPNQIDYVNKNFGKAFWRTRERMVEPTHCQLPETKH